MGHGSSWLSHRQISSEWWLWASGGEKLDMALFSEERGTEKEAILYPANSLRNRALILARTEVGVTQGVPPDA
jgi:hypothetical protein